MKRTTKGDAMLAKLSRGETDEEIDALVERLAKKLGCTSDEARAELLKTLQRTCCAPHQT